MPAVASSVLPPALAVEVAALRAQLLADDGIDLDDVADRVGRWCHQVGDRSSAGRRLATLHHLLESHLLAALDLDLAGLPPERAAALLTRARHHMAEGLHRLLASNAA